MSQSAGGQGIGAIDAAVGYPAVSPDVVPSASATDSSISDAKPLDAAIAEEQEDAFCASISLNGVPVDTVSSPSASAHLSSRLQAVAPAPLVRSRSPGGTEQPRSNRSSPSKSGAKSPGREGSADESPRRAGRCPQGKRGSAGKLARDALNPKDVSPRCSLKDASPRRVKPPLGSPASPLRPEQQRSSVSSQTQRPSFSQRTSLIGLSQQSPSCQSPILMGSPRTSTAKAEALRSISKYRDEMLSRLAAEFPHLYVVEGDPTGFVPCLSMLRSQDIAEADEPLSPARTDGRGSGRSRAQRSSLPEIESMEGWELPKKEVERATSAGVSQRRCSWPCLPEKRGRLSSREIAQLSPNDLEHFRPRGSRAMSKDVGSSRASSLDDSEPSSDDDEDNPAFEVPAWLITHGAAARKSSKESNDKASSFGDSSNKSDSGSGFSDVSDDK